MKITSPIKGFNGKSAYGPVTLHFEGGVAEVDAVGEGLRHYLESRGFGLDETEQSEPEDSEQTEAPDEFDPSEHTVDEVREYLQAPGSPSVTADEWDRVIAAESAGKARKGILEYEPEGNDA